MSEAIAEAKRVNRDKYRALILGLTVLAIALSIWAILLAFRTTKQISSVEAATAKIKGQAVDIAQTIEDIRSVEFLTNYTSVMNAVIFPRAPPVLTSSSIIRSGKPKRAIFFFS